MTKDSKSLQDAGEIVLQVLAKYLSESQEGEQPVLSLRSIREIADTLQLESWIRNGGLNAPQVANFLHTYLDNTIRMHHPGYIGHQVSIPHINSALAELIHGVSNNPMAIYEMGPAAAVMELVVVNWMLEKAGWGQTDSLHDATTASGAGVLTHGGSLANLTALLGARAAIAPEAWEQGNPQDLVILAPASAHYSVSRAAAIIGLGTQSIIPLPVDKREVVIPDEIPAIHKSVIENGQRVMALVANGCATSTGLYDPLAEIGAYCQSANIWLHVDSPHGAAALVSDKERHLMKGIELADSFTWDAHKMLRTSTLCTAVLFRERQAFQQVFRQKASYIFYEKEIFGIDFIEHTVECTKAGLGMKLFWVIAAEGEAGLATYVDAQFAKTRRFYEIVNQRSGFHSPIIPQSNILCFRYGTDDQMQVTIRDQLLRNGNFHISSTEIHGERFLRLSVMNPMTDEVTIGKLLDEIESIAVEIG